MVISNGTIRDNPKCQYPLLVHWDGMDTWDRVVISNGNIRDNPKCPYPLLVHWDGMDT